MPKINTEKISMRKKNGIFYVYDKRIMLFLVDDNYPSKKNIIVFVKNNQLKTQWLESVIKSQNVIWM